MCEYCGCQDIDVIAELTAEHDELRNLGHELSKAANTGDLVAARPIAATMLGLLGPHTEVEERGLFPALEEQFGEQLTRLVEEHTSIETALAALAGDDPPSSWRAATQLALAHLFDHILKEQDGVFPAALGSLSAREWEALAAVRAAVGSRLPVA